MTSKDMAPTGKAKEILDNLAGGHARCILIEDDGRTRYGGGLLGFIPSSAVRILVDHEWVVCLPSRASLPDCTVAAWLSAAGFDAATGHPHPHRHVLAFIEQAARRFAIVRDETGLWIEDTTDGRRWATWSRVGLAPYAEYEAAAREWHKAATEYCLAELGVDGPSPDWDALLGPDRRTGFPGCVHDIVPGLLHQAAVANRGDAVPHDLARAV